MAETYNLTVWSCYVCPYAWRGAEWLGRVQEKLGESLQMTWKAFLLEQVNSRRELGWKAWEDPRFTRAPQKFEVKRRRASYHSRDPSSTTARARRCCCARLA